VSSFSSYLWNNCCCLTVILAQCVHLVFFISVVAENTDSKLITGEDKSGYQKHVEHECLKLHVDKERTGDGSEVPAAVNAADGLHTEATVKVASESCDASHKTGWLPAWNLSSLTQLTGAVTSTVRLVLKHNSCHPLA